MNENFKRVYKKKILTDSINHFETLNRVYDFKGNNIYFGY